MAYGLVGELLCTTKKGNLYKVDISLDGFTGSPIDRNIPVSPFKLKKDKASVIRGTSFDFSIREENDFEFLPFYTNKTKSIKVDLYDPSDNLIWSGYNLPQQYSVPYSPAPASVTFTASDGLGLLKTEPFTLTGINSQLDIIRHCIDKIGIDLGYSIAINLFEITHDHSLTPLAQTYEDCEIFASLNCYDVLEGILVKYTAEITQRNGRWAITRNADKKSTRMLYSSAGEYETTETAPAVLTLGMPGGTGVDVWPKGVLQMGLEPGGKKLQINFDYGRKSSFLTNPDFSKFTSPTFEGWTQEGTFTPEQRINENGPYLFIPGNNDEDGNLYQEIEIENAASEDFVFSLEMGVLASRLYGGLEIPIPVTLKFIVALFDGTNFKFLSKDGWTDTLATIDIVTTSQIGGAPKMNKLEIITKELPFDGTLQVKLYRIETTQLYNYTFIGVAFGHVNLYFISNGELYPAGIQTVASFTNSSEPNDLPLITLLSADAPDYPNAILLYKNITRLSDGSLTTLWHVLGSSATFTILQQIALALASDNRVARQKLTGEIKGNGIAFDSIIKHPYNNNREFEIAEGVWDIYEETFSVTLLELLAWSDETVEFSSVNQNQSSSGSSGSGSGGSSSTPVSVDLATVAALAKYFEVVNPGEANEYLRCKLPFAGDYEVQAWTDTMVVLDSHAFQTPSFADPLNLDATIFKDFKCGTITGGTTINLNNTVDGDAGMIEILMDSTGGYTVALGTMFTKKLGETDLVTDADTDNFISWRMVGADIVYTIAQVV